MGTDIYSSRGIIATVDEFLGVIKGKNKKEVVRVSKAFLEDLIAQYKSDPVDWRSDLVNNFQVLSTLESTMPVFKIKEIIESCVEVEGEPAKYGECYVLNAEYIQDFFEKIIDVSGFDLPYIQQVTAWGSGRYNGWDVPKGVACVVFDSEECYVKTLSEQGEAVKLFLGHCDETEWTEISY